jgi:hypothetical protein
MMTVFRTNDVNIAFDSLEEKPKTIHLDGGFLLPKES